MATSAFVLFKAQEAVRSFLSFSSIGDIAAGNVWAQLNKDERTRPCIIVQATSATPTEGHPFGGTWNVSVSVQIRSDSDKSTAAEHEARCDTVFDLLLDTTIAASLSAELDNFTAFLVVPESQSFGVDDPDWVSVITLSVECCGSDIA